ncbi:acyl-CoA-binding protein [Polaribacter vadi]|uniref:acyl-CoA-binding protein n=1 Tax=Polaribacter TaxID=52959 RepID=UPI001C087AC6|nr:acyl-CoA-binding protein [Polaribacter sp. 1_MG-2023]MBU3012926.1 acyl-CoA-binding protein [Polaribacter vadi]MDO6742744.1 acyl-CoA-binding protein [Polaribacter sp. 1_MG-2023]
MSKLSQKNRNNSDDLDEKFKTAFKKISELKEAVAPDNMLKLYAYYKQANFGNKFSNNNELDVRNAFKFNAWMQLNGMSVKEAKQEYITLANIILNSKNLKS